MTDTHLERGIKSLRSRLSRVPAVARLAHHQIAARHVRLALHILPKNETAAREHFKLATHAASHVLPLISGV